MNTRKILSLLVALILALGCVSITAMAEETPLSDNVVFPTGMTAENCESLFGANTVTDGTNYYATLSAAVKAVDGKSGAVLYCKPGADFSSENGLNHLPVTATLTVYGNGATVPKGETFDIGNTDKNEGTNVINGDMTFTVYNMNNCTIWGTMATEYTVSIVVNGCTNMGEVFLMGNTGTLNISITDCTFTSNDVSNCKVYSNANGTISLNNVSFSNVDKAVNLNHKAAGTQTIILDGCTFTNCGNNVAAGTDEIPVRILSSVEGGKSVATITNCSFSGTPTGGADILLDYGVGTATADISGTAANLSVETESNVATTQAITANDVVAVSDRAITVTPAASPVAKIGETSYATLAEAFAAAQNGDEVVITAAGTYSVPSGKSITVRGAVEGVVFDNIGQHNTGSANMTFDNVTFDYYPNVDYTGLQHAGNLVYNNCTFNGQVFLYGNSETFNKCTFNQNSSDYYNVWTYGAKEVKFNECEFNSAGKSVLVYNEGGSATKLNVEKTAFKASAAVAGKAAIEIDTSLMPSGTKIVVDGETTATGFATDTKSSSRLWNDKKVDSTRFNGGTTSVVIVAGETVKDSVENAPEGSLGQMYVQAANTQSNTTDRNRVYGEVTGIANVKESLVIKLYSGEVLLATTNCAKPELLGNATLGVNIVISGSNSGSWNTVWESGMPRADLVPTSAVLYLDGREINTANVTLDGIDALGTPVVWESLPGVNAVGLSGSGTAEDPYLINNLEDLIWFRDTVNTYQSDGSNQFKDKYVKLNADIDLDGINWTPIGKNSVGDHMAFLGTFDGNNHTISNLYINSAGDHLGFFARVGGYTENCTPTVKNLKFNNIDVSTTVTNHWTAGHGDYVGGVIANAGGNSIVSNITVTGDVYVVGCGYVGGIVGHGYPDIDNCHVKANEGSYLHAGYWCAGGIIGYAGEGGTPITNCSVSGLDIWSAYGAAAAVAGLLQDGNTITNVSAENVEITSNSDYCMGYIAGNGECSTMTDVTAKNVTATANGNAITATDAVADVNGIIYFDFQTALKSLTSGATLTLLSDVTVDYYWDSRYTGGKITVPVTIDGNGHTLKFTKEVYDAGNQYSVFRFTDAATVKNLTIDMSEAISCFGGRFRAISTGADLSVNNCTFIGNGSDNNTRAIIYGEGSGAAIGEVEISITDSVFTGWRRAVSDNENAQDAKSVVITGNTINDAAVYISASETVTFTGNTVEGGYVNIKSYSAAANLVVTATGNTLTANGEGNNINKIDVASKNVTAQPEFVIPAKGTNSPAYTKEVDGYVRIWGQSENTNASKSFVLKLYSNDALMATTELNNVGNIIDGSQDSITWNFYYPESNDEYWTTTWEKGHPNTLNKPTKVELYIDGTLVSTTDAQMNGADGLNPVIWENLGGVQVPALPDAEVKNLGRITVEEGEYYVYDLIGGTGLKTAAEPFDVSIAMQFDAKDSPEEAAANAYANYTTDFFIKIDGIENGSFVGDGCYLAGYYPSFGAWVKIPLDGFTIESGKTYPVITSAGFDFSYVDICTSVEQFICGIYLTDEIIAANPDIKVNLSLGLSENKDDALNADFKTVDDYTYEAKDFVKEEEADETIIFGTPFYMVNLPQPDANTYKVGLYSGIDSLNYKEVGFRVFTMDGQLLARKATNTVYNSVKGNNMTLTAEQIGSFRIYGAHALFPVEWDNISVVFQPFAVDLTGREILGNKYLIEDVYTK